MERAQGAMESLIIIAAVIVLGVIVIGVANMMLAPGQESTELVDDKYNAALSGVDLVGYEVYYDGTPKTMPDKIVYRGEDYPTIAVADGTAEGEFVAAIGDENYGIYIDGGDEEEDQHAEVEADCPAMSVSDLAAFEEVVITGVCNCGGGWDPGGDQAAAMTGFIPEPGPGTDPPPDCPYDTLDYYTVLTWNAPDEPVENCFGHYAIYFNDQLVDSTTDTTYTHEYDTGHWDATYGVDVVNADGIAGNRAFVILETNSDRGCVQFY